ncbi:MAG: hypothetical protein M3Q86_13170 [Verrucomicrobiota bacterium]|nr:hypothetical protein [Verrucomicrobiota bacterium]
MLKRALIVAASVGFSLPLAAEQPAADAFVLNRTSPSEMVKGRPALGRAGSFRTLTNVWSGNGPLTLVDGRLFSFPGAFGWVEATPDALLPALAVQARPRLAPATTLESTTGNEKLELLRKPDYVGGEVGFFYGRSFGGKYSREVEQGYILGEIVEGNTRIQVGASYGQSTGSTPRIIGR